MFALTVAVSLVLAGLLTASALIKLTRREPYVQTYLRLGVPEHRLNLLAAVLLAGVAGLLLGLWWTPLGVAAAAGVLCYFLLAIGAHLRGADARNLPMPAGYAALAGAALLLRLATG
jgi:hypothetical protein